MMRGLGSWVVLNHFENLVGRTMHYALCIWMLLLCVSAQNLPGVLLLPLSLRQRWAGTLVSATQEDKTF